jgi:quercetin dioxygenase-like cupin family protein
VATADAIGKQGVGEDTGRLSLTQRIDAQLAFGSYESRGQENGPSRRRLAACQAGIRVARRGTANYRPIHTTHGNGDGQAKGECMKLTTVVLALACLMSSALVAQEAKVTELMSKDLKDCAGKEGLMITVEYPPGSSDPIHRHNAHGFIYVLEGSIVMQVRGGKEVTLTPGQTFYEGPEDVHVVGRNASDTKPAKFVVFFVKDKGAPVLVPTK